MGAQRSAASQHLLWRPSNRHGATAGMDRQDNCHKTAFDTWPVPRRFEARERTGCRAGPPVPALRAVPGHRDPAVLARQPPAPPRPGRPRASAAPRPQPARARTSADSATPRVSHRQVVEPWAPAGRGDADERGPREQRARTECRLWVPIRYARRAASGANVPNVNLWSTFGTCAPVALSPEAAEARAAGVRGLPPLDRPARRSTRRPALTGPHQARAARGRAPRARPGSEGTRPAPGLRREAARPTPRRPRRRRSSTRPS